MNKLALLDRDSEICRLLEADDLTSEEVDALMEEKCVIEMMLIYGGDGVSVDDAAERMRALEAQE